MFFDNVEWQPVPAEVEHYITWLFRDETPGDTATYYIVLGKLGGAKKVNEERRIGDKTLVRFSGLVVWEGETYEVATLLDDGTNEIKYLMRLATRKERRAIFRSLKAQIRELCQ